MRVEAGVGGGRPWGSRWGEGSGDGGGGVGVEALTSPSADQVTALSLL